MFKRVFKYIGVGVTATLVDFAVYTTLVAMFQHEASLRGVAQTIAGVVSTIAAYFMHSRITWKEHDPGQRGVAMFFLWNALTVLVIRNALFKVFGAWTGVYQVAYDLLSWAFDYDAVETLGIYGLTTVVTMTLNYLVYDRLVFGKDKRKGDEEIEVKGVGEARKEVKRKKEGKGKGRKED